MVATQRKLRWRWNRHGCLAFRGRAELWPRRVSNSLRETTVEASVRRLNEEAHSAVLGLQLLDEIVLWGVSSERGMASATKEDVFKPIESPKHDRSGVSGDEKPESHGRSSDVTAATEDAEVKAPGLAQRVAEEVEAIASEVWAAITPGSQK